MKRLSFQWRITLLTALLIAGTCICLNLLLYHSGAVSMDSLNGFVFEYTPETPHNPDGLSIEISDSQMSEFISRFSDEVYDVKADFGRNGWLITIAVTIVSAAIAYFVSGQALKPLRKLSQQAEKIDQDSISDIRLNENTLSEFRQLSVSVNLMLDRLSESFATQRQFSGNAAHELRTPLAIMQTKLELFAAEHKNMEGDTAELVRSQAEQLDRLSKLVHTLLEMSNLSSAQRRQFQQLNTGSYFGAAQETPRCARLRPCREPRRRGLCDRRRKQMKRLSFQWRITLLTALLIAGTCICLNLLLYHSGAVSMDSLNGFVFEYTPETPHNPDGLSIEISDSQMSEFISRFSDEVYDVKADFGRNGWLITIAVTIVSAAIAYFVSGQALKPLRKLSQQAAR